MKVIDILNKKANGTLKDEFKFCYKDEVFTYDKNEDKIFKADSFRELGEIYIVEACLNDEVLLFQEEVKETEKRKENKEIEELNDNCYNNEFMADDEKDYYHNNTRKKLNELVRTVNKLIKEREEK